MNDLTKCFLLQNPLSLTKILEEILEFAQTGFLLFDLPFECLILVGPETRTSYFFRLQFQYYTVTKTGWGKGGISIRKPLDVDLPCRVHRPKGFFRQKEERMNLAV